MKYLNNGLNSFQNTITYRANFFISIFSRVIQLSLSFFMWSAIYAGSNSDSVGGYTQPEMFKYLILTGLLSFVFTFEPIFRLARSVQTGQLNTLLLRPINIKWESLSAYIGSKLIFIFILIVAIMLFSGGNVFNVVKLIVYLLISLVLWHELMFMIGSLSFWIIQMWPLRPIINAFYLFFGGLLFPLDVLPDFWYQCFRFLPVALVSSDFVQALIKIQTAPSLIIEYLLISIIWLIGLTLMTNKLFSNGLKHFEGVGA
ncbi:ABC transporter permease [Weissella minor]|uniref:ABC transporter permease n=1 Tax=Weissella minor TaxID=1620 RepID=A0A0R2JHN2_9LACO|nr:ABC-2 family transporter protein [Weissella minor]KRN76815.1 hypothetical protein IV67_GL000324 [Weissella minor]